MSFANLLHLYRVRLRSRLLQECFAVVGLAAGVALLFASQIAANSLSSSAAQLSSGIVGSAKLQLLARDARGVDQRLLGRVRQIPGVRLAAPLLEANANALGPRGSRSVELIGADESLKSLGGALVRKTKLAPFGGIGAIVIPHPLARRIGVTKFGAEATLQVGGHVGTAPLYQQLSAREIGPLIDTPIVVAPLSFAQELAHLPGRVSRVLVAPRPGREAQVRAALLRLARGRLNVTGTDYDQQLFAKAAAASNQSTTLFAVISALVGFLFAFNAMLLTVGQRRRLIADLRRDGYMPRAVIGVLLLDALLLGLVGCLLGLALGDELSLQLFRANPGFLSSAFTVGNARVVGAQSIAIAVAGGMLAAIVAVLSPLRDILSRDPLAAVAPPREGGGATGSRDASGERRWSRRAVRLRGAPLRATLGALAIAAALVTMLAFPAAAIAGIVALVLALLLLLPLALDAVLSLTARTARRLTGAVPHVAVGELRAGRSRAVAIAATGAVAVFGSVAIQGAHRDLQHGLENAATDMNAFTGLWVSPAGGFDLLMTQPFPQGATLQALSRVPGVRSVGVYRGGLLDWGQRRVWVIAPPRDAQPIVPPTQLVEGDLALAQRRLRAGGWAVLSKALAAEHHLHIGEAFTLPAPRPTAFRLAAISTNIGWAPGAAILRAEDFARAWESPQPSAYNLHLAPGTNPEQARRAVASALGPASGLAVQTARQHAAKQDKLTREGLARLSQIATLILAAAVLATAAATGAMVWQRRPRLAKLKLEGFAPAELWRTVLLESGLLLLVGCAAGALLGLLGQQLLDRALAEVINYPVVRSLALPTALGALALVTAAALAVLSVPGYLAARVPAALALQD
ncbi:MAG TPA: FtsX-like permease family protein [Solirubrobacteraceae bacterium]|nr:FtsX-like permease family protein [Solirubrobacteraceae bacterium]